jgi:hypothetical protein
MECRDRRTSDAVTEIVGILAAAYERSRQAPKIEDDAASAGVHGELANPRVESLPVHEVDT